MYQLRVNIVQNMIFQGKVTEDAITAANKVLDARKKAFKDQNG